MNGSTLVVGLAGGSATGKTSFIEALVTVFGGHELCVVSMDNYYRPLSSQHRDENGMVNYDLPEGIDFNRLRKDLRSLQQGKSVKIVEYTFNNSARFPSEIVLTPAPIILVEGLFVLTDKRLRAFFDITMMIATEHHIALKRRLRRDVEERGMTEDEVIYQWEQHVLPAYETYLVPHKNNVNLLIDNNMSFDSGLREVEALFKGYLAQK